MSYLIYTETLLELPRPTNNTESDTNGNYYYYSLKLIEFNIISMATSLLVN